ncbi:MAG: PAS domain S-box protein, partial [Candidatus Heimdallarchaeota archaeon]
MTKPVKPSEDVKSNSIKISQTKKESEMISIEDKLEELNQDLIISERRALGLFELTNDAIFIINMNGEYADLNQRAAELLGYNRHDMIGRSLFDFIVDSELESSKKKLEDLIAGRILPIYERRFKRRDGSTFPAEINAAIVQDEDGNPAYIQSAMRDITERVEAEETLERERKAFHLIAESTIYATNLADLCQRIAEGLAKILDFDSATIRLYDPDTRLLTPVAFIDYSKEVSTEDIVPQSIDNHNFVFALAARNKRAIVSPRFEDRALLAPFQDRMLKLGIFAIITWPILDANEDLLGVVQLVSHKPKDIPEEDMLFFETIARMFTVAIERKSAEEALKESEEKYRSFAQKFQGIAYRTKMDWTPIFYNGAVEEITGYTDEELKSWNP